MRADANVGQRVRALRLERGLSQRDLAAPGMSYAYLSRIEAGERTPSLSALIELADRLDTSALYLATGKTSGRCPLCGRT
jgi:transcriptional regulator with XRE-family HTH domain